jgi:transcriptional regulator with AAA-type ATPase domain
LERGDELEEFERAAGFERARTFEPAEGAMSTIETLEAKLGRDTGAETQLVSRGTSGAPRLIVSLECQRPTVLGSRLMLERLDRVVVARGDGVRIERTDRIATIFVGDFQTSRQHLAIRRTSSGWRVEDLGSKNGTVVNGEHIESAMLADGDLIEAGGTLLMFLDDGGPPGGAEDRDLSAADDAIGLLPTMSVALELQFQQILKIARTAVPVLVRGETGTGKELMARTIHETSGRRGPFVPVNCGALPRDLVESELFGHRRGAFSGATEDREGLVRRAHHGTLFLDEIAELPLDAQVALLRVLQDGEVRPVGASSAATVDVRIVAATHQDLTRRIAERRFRHDLYARIAGFEVRMPALRGRREDLGVLIATILSRLCADPERVTLSKTAARALFRYPWPLNIRELEQALRSAVGLRDGCEIRVEHLPTAIRDYRPPGDPALSAKDRALREHLIELLREESGNVAAVGRAMNRAPIQIRRWCSRLRIDLGQFRE